jgi:UDP-N-acetylglucosamine 2-epimerase (hydrolysing)
MKKKILFLTGTRADFGKIKSLMKIIDKSKKFELSIFVTGMHTLVKYGYTVDEVLRSFKQKRLKGGLRKIQVYNNQAHTDSMDIALSKTIVGFSEYVNQFSPDLIVLHGDRIEALGAAIVGALNNVKVAHIEGGEISGTIDETIRHSITKLSNLHFVASRKAKKRLIQMGEGEKNIFQIGSPDIDLMFSNKLPSIAAVKKKYSIIFKEYCVLIYHPITTDIKHTIECLDLIIDRIKLGKENFVIIYPNNDYGTDLILSELLKIKKNSNVVLLPSMRVEYFLTLIKNSQFIIGNSSSGIMEAPVYGVPTINISNRQKLRLKNISIKSLENPDAKKLNNLINKFYKKKKRFKSIKTFGSGKSDRNFFKIIKKKNFWKNKNTQKKFYEIEKI